ncbi:MAG: TusE/DsrC/DsvC family sulfur relay protein [Holophagaceae bacterium]|nr:TusE/DsrC/DsvC family sulfur relay protein [Holophagaceae bacterium]
MTTIDFNGTPVEINEEGFLVDPNVWNEELALALAKHEEGLEELTKEHWAVIRFIRTYFEENNSAPMVRAVCKGSGIRLQQIYDLFPSGPAKGACKLAGLPKPDGCV